MRTSIIIITLIVILILSLFLNSWGIKYGLPDKLYPDEGRIVNHALAFGMGDLNPHYFHYPALSMYLLFILYGSYYIAGYLGGFFQSPNDFQLLFFSNPTSFYLIGRFWISLTGVAVIAAIFCLAKQVLRNKRAALLASLTIATLPYFVFYCHFIVNDPLLLLFILLSYIYIIKISHTGKMSAYATAGIFAGLGTATKYSPVILIIPIIVAHILFLRSKQEKLSFRALFWPPFVAGGLLVLVFFLASPFCFIDYSNFLESLKFRENLGHVHTFGTKTGTAWFIYVKYLFQHRFLIFNRFDPLGIILLGGIIWTICRRRKSELLLLIFPAIIYIIIGRWSFGRLPYALLLVTFLTIPGAGLIIDLFDRIKGSSSSILRSCGPILLWGFVGITIIFNLVNSILMDIKLSHKDTRTLAREWVESTIPPGTKIAIEWDTEATVQLWESPDTIQRKINGYDSGDKKTIHHPPEQMSKIHQMRLDSVPSTNYDIIRMGEMIGTKIEPINYSLDKLIQDKVTYIISSSEISWIFHTPIAAEMYPEQVEFYRRLKNESELIKEFSPDRSFNLGPKIKIYRLTPPENKTQTP